MDFRTIVDITASPWKIDPCERMLFIGSCFADNMGKRFQTEKFRAMVNPYGVMYNPASILHTIDRLVDEDRLPFKADEKGTAVFTLGTNHVYVLKSTGEIVDNCNKRPQHLFDERELSVDDCARYLRQAVDTIHRRFPLVRFIFTVSPIRYRKYGFHGSQLSKATLLLAVHTLTAPTHAHTTSAPAVALQALGHRPDSPMQPAQTTDTATAQTVSGASMCYFPAYEIINDELRDYRFYTSDMLHPTEQAVEYIYERMAETFFSEATFRFLKAWKPIREALAHRPFNPDSAEYQAFLQQAKEREQLLLQQYITE